MAVSKQRLRLLGVLLVLALLPELVQLGETPGVAQETRVPAPDGWSGSVHPQRQVGPRPVTVGRSRSGRTEITAR